MEPDLNAYARSQTIDEILARLAYCTFVGELLSTQPTATATMMATWS